MSYRTRLCWGQTDLLKDLQGYLLSCYCKWKQMKRLIIASFFYLSAALRHHPKIVTYRPGHSIWIKLQLASCCFIQMEWPGLYVLSVSISVQNWWQISDIAELNFLKKDNNIKLQAKMQECVWIESEILEINI